MLRKTGTFHFALTARITLKNIANNIESDKSTVSIELKINKDLRGYRPNQVRRKMMSKKTVYKASYKIFKLSIHY